MGGGVELLWLCEGIFNGKGGEQSLWGALEGRLYLPDDLWHPHSNGSNPARRATQNAQWVGWLLSGSGLCLLRGGGARGCTFGARAHLTVSQQSACMACVAVRSMC